MIVGGIAVPVMLEGMGMYNDIAIRNMSMIEKICTREKSEKKKQ